MMKKFNKKGQEVQYLIFFCVFITIMGIISSIFLKTVIKNEVQKYDETKVGNILGAVISWFDDLPIVGPLLNIFFGNFSFIFINDYLTLIFVSLLGPPLAYIFIKLIKGVG